MNTTKTSWVISKVNGHKFKIHQIYNYDGSYEGNRVPLNDKNISGILSYLHISIDKLDGFIISKELDEKQYNDFCKSFNIKLVFAKNNLPDKYKRSLQSKVNCDRPGAYKLIRSASRDQIYIALRVNRSVDALYGISYINAVCIPDSWKSSFFDDADRLNVPIGRKHYISASNGSVFKDWSDKMDKEYERQLRVQNTNKTNGESDT